MLVRVIQIFKDLHRLLLKDIFIVLHFVTNEVVQMHMTQEQHKKPHS